MPSWFPGNLAEAALFAPLRIVFLIIVLVLVRVIIHRVLDRVVRRAVHGYSAFRPTEKLTQLQPNGAANARREQRLTALGSLAKSIVTVLLLIIGVVMVLAELGFNVTSLIAGTSIVGVSLAFGMQNVVKDLVSGVFMLVEDQLGTGDVVDMQQAGVNGGGTVEAIGLRVSQLRTSDGTVVYVRNGEITRVLNYSQGGPGVLPIDQPDEPGDDEDDGRDDDGRDDGGKDDGGRDDAGKGDGPAEDGEPVTRADLPEGRLRPARPRG